jgi:hypothetical protein
MIDTCFNPDCRQALRHLRDGRVVRVIHGIGVDATVEHFWLCGTCYEKHDFAFPADGTVKLVDKRQPHSREVRFGDIVLSS